MIFRTLAAVALAGLLLVPAAKAADIDQSGGQYTQDSERPFSWTGFYLGGRVGYGNANHKLGLEAYNLDYCYDYNGSTLPGNFDPISTGIYSGHGSINDDSGSIYAVPTAGCEAANSDGGTSNSADILVNSSSTEIANLDGVNSSGIVGGVQVGADKQIGRFVIGVFGSYDLASMDTEASIGDINLTLIEKGDEWSIGARFGYLLHPRVLAYALAAYTQGDWTFGDSVLGEKEVTFQGVTVGGGLEYALTRNIFLGMEATHTFYDKETVADSGTDDPCVVCRGHRLTDEIGETKVMGTIKAKVGTSDVGLD